MLTVTTQDGAVYSMAVQDWGQHGRMLVISRTGGTDDPPVSNKPMDQGRWYHVHVLNPVPPMIGTQLSMVLDPVLDDPDPLVRKTGMVTSVVGLLEPRTPPITTLYEPGPAPDVTLAPHLEPADPHSVVPPRAASSAVGVDHAMPFLNDQQKFTKSTGLFAAVLGYSVALGRRR